MINDDTQLVIIDEWSARIMTSDLVKTILQGGWIVTAVKHILPKQINCYSPFYITTKNVPDTKTRMSNAKFMCVTHCRIPPSRLALISGYSTMRWTASPGLHTN